MPYWKNECNHPEGTYVASFTSRYGSENDLYVYPGEYGGDHVCIRYGDDGPDYHSVTTLRVLILGAAAGHEVYEDAVNILMSNGTLHWRKKRS